MKNIYHIIVILFLLLVHSIVIPAELKIAVASNFLHPIKKIIQIYQQQTGHEVKVSFASTGKHYLQILHGAPYDIFFAADVKRPLLLEQKRKIVAASRYSYAYGRLVLWSADKNMDNIDELILNSDQYNYISIANPKLAPFGKAAKQVLHHLGIWHGLNNKLVQGENIAQAFQFVKTGNAQLGFVALSQISHLPLQQKGAFWLVPEELYSPIEQQLVLLKNNPIASDFIKFVKSDTIKEIIFKSGYHLERLNHKQ